MAQTGDIIGPAIQAFLQGQQLRTGQRSEKLAERKLELQEEQLRFKTGAARKKSERETADSSLIEQILQGILPALQGGGAPQPQQQAAPPTPTRALTPTPSTTQAQVSIGPSVPLTEDIAQRQQSRGLELQQLQQQNLEASQRTGIPLPAGPPAVPEVGIEGPVTPAPAAAPPPGLSAVAQEQARQQVDLNTPDTSFNLTVGGRSVQVSNLKGTPEQKFKRLLAAAKKDARAQGIGFDIAEFKRIFGDSVLPEAGKKLFKRAFRDETTKAIAQRRKDARAAQVKGEKRPLNVEEDLQIKREVFDDAIVRFGGLPEGVDAPKGLESLERTAQEAEAAAFGKEIGTGAAKAEGPIPLTSELTKLEAQTNGFPQDIRKLSSLQARTLLEAAKNDQRTSVSDKFFFAARAAGLGEDVLAKIRNRDFANIAQTDIQALMSELVKTDSLTALITQILGSPAGGGVAPTAQGRTPDEIEQRRQELIRKRDAK